MSGDRSSTEQGGETFGVFAEVSVAMSESGCPSITLYTARGESMFGGSLSAYWSLTLDEAVALGAGLIKAAGRAQYQAQEYEAGRITAEARS